MKFRDEATKRMTIVRQIEAKEHAERLAAMEASKSQVQIAWDNHEKLSEQLKEV